MSFSNTNVAINSQTLVDKKIEPRQIDELRLRVPTELKQTLKQLAKQRKTTLNNLGFLLINQMLGRKPDLMSTLSDSILRFKYNSVLLADYRAMMSAYSLLHLESSTNSPSFLSNCDRFIRQADKFVSRLIEEKSN